ncbi:MAG TPA: hypothetical protein VGI57_00335 [Usitatibacter sp.]
MSVFKLVVPFGAAAALVTATHGYGFETAMHAAMTSEALAKSQFWTAVTDVEGLRRGS